MSNQQNKNIQSFNPNKNKPDREVVVEKTTNGYRSYVKDNQPINYEIR